MLVSPPLGKLENKYADISLVTALWEHYNIESYLLCIA